MRIARGVGDMVIEAVEDALRRAFRKSRIEFSFEELLDGNVLAIGRGLQASVNKLFTMSGLCQFVDQENSLAELSHKLRFTYMGEGGVTAQTAESFMREVQLWHLGKLCPIESPEGQSVGLIVELATYANIEDGGHIVTAYNKVRNGFISKQMVYLNCFDEKLFVASIRNVRLRCCAARTPGLKSAAGELPAVEICMPLSAQMFSPAVNLIPFLEHNDPTRALMAANMQKQAVPLLVPQPPLVGTGMEGEVVAATRHNVVVSSSCVTASVDANQVVVFEPRAGTYKVYEIPDVRCTNQNMCARTRVVVRPRQVLRSGDVIAECQSSARGEMSLGANLIVAFVCWNGLNYEDSVVLSEDVVARGTFLSLHLIELETSIRKTELGEERTTRDLPTIGLRYKAHLPVNGIVQIGSVVREGDVLVGKLSPVRLSVRSRRERGIDAAADAADNASGFADSSGFDAGSDASMACAAAYIAAGGNPSDRLKVHYAMDSSLRVPAGVRFASVVGMSFASESAAEAGSKFRACVEAYKVIRGRYVRRICALRRRAEASVLSQTCKVQDELVLLGASYEAEIERLF